MLGVFNVTWQSSQGSIFGLTVFIFILVVLITTFSTVFSAGTHRHEDVPLWSYFGRDVPHHNRTKIGRVRFLTYFISAMSDVHLTLKNI